MNVTCATDGPSAGGPEPADRAGAVGALPSQQAAAGPGFRHVVELNEAAKDLLARSFRINLLALAAMVQSKRGGNSLRGFDEVSAQMRRWSGELHAELERLRELSRTVVADVSRVIKSTRLLQLLDRASVPRAQQVAIRAELEELERELAQHWRSVRNCVSDLDQLGLMAAVLSRSAMIEATSGTAEQRAQLAQVSNEFYVNAESVTHVLQALSKALRSSR